ncbi:hypothetical protein GYY_01840 [Methanococcus maripaludis X1]|uniref:Uncharacterized protein n=1 Tax=Methanococcus maripaludis X1 TaxID=1053692 RepID=G0H2Q6_METMI|nr:hypothetical protein GYY_01840 [Methanococcus maripaludis X1]
MDNFHMIPPLIIEFPIIYLWINVFILFTYIIYN